MRYKTLLLFAVMTIGIGGAMSQQVSPCPTIPIAQRPDNMNDPYYHQNPMYVHNGWDTAITCAADFIELSVEPYIPVQWFNGTYTVEEIAYDPPDPTFHGGQHLDITSDDQYCSTPTQIAFPFYFFGKRKTQFVVGSNCIVTFDSTAAGQYCPYSIQSSNVLPWSRASEHLNDAILGVYEDTDLRTNYNNQAAPHYQGAWYGIQGTYPCRKIIASWNDVATYNGSDNNNHRCTYQIVCYEGSNIIEVHIKKRSLDRGGPPSGNWNGLRGIVGIVNHDGQPQQHSTVPGAPNQYVVNGSPAAFFPAGFNQTTDSLYHRAFRFTPQGSTFVTAYWYRIYDDGRPNDTLSTNPNDPNGYYIPMNTNSATHPTLSKAFVHPDTISRYVISAKFKNAKGDWYSLSDTITIGIDTANDMRLKQVSEDGNQHGICHGANTTVNLEIPEDQTPHTITWTVERIINGNRVALPASMYSLDAERLNLTLLPDPQSDTLPENKVDSISIQAFVEFQSSCTNYDTFLVVVIPNYNVVDKRGICRGKKLNWYGHTYTESTNEPKVVLQTVDGCDSIVHLDLTVFDVSHTWDHISDCKPITWIDGNTYAEDNNTATFKDTNAYGCDSIIQLDLTIHPLTPRIESNMDHFDMDHLDVVLRDVSIGGDSRRWVFPSGPEQTSATAYYTIPADLDQADIKLIAHSPYGCENDTNIVIPLVRENFWAPNVFRPDDNEHPDNKLFRSFSEGTLSQEMYVYNRLGEQIYYCSGVDCTWDGTDLNGQPCPQGAYVYIIRYTNIFEPKKVKVARGTVTLLR